MPEEFAEENLSRPPWLHEQPGIEALLNKVVDKLDKNPQATPGYTLNQKLLPELFVQGEKADLIWELLQTLFATNYNIFSYRENKKRNPLDSDYSDARIRFIPAAESLIRSWLNRPVEPSELELWQLLVEKNTDQFPGECSRLISRKISVSGKSIDDVMQGFLSIKHYQQQKITLRNLSARCFWQDSKFLDSREDIVQQLYPQLKIKTRPVLVNIFLPETIQGLLFIENQDSYTQGIFGVPAALKNMALIYSAGYKLGADRVRQTDSASLHFHGLGNHQFQQMLTDWWYGVEECQMNNDNKNDWPVTMPVYFWGDLDYAGLNILSTLRRRFENIQAWQPGYQPMLELLLSGAGHAPEATGKQEQKYMGNTGCVYADEKLLPALRATGRFVDQEWICE